MRSNFLLTLTALIWGTAFVAQSVGMDYVGPFTFLASRNFIAVIVLLPLIKIMSSGKKKDPDRILKETASGKVMSPADGNVNGYAKDTSEHDENAKGTKFLVIGGIACGTILCIASSFQQVGIAHTTVGKAGFLTAMYILIVPLLGLFVKKKVPLKVWISVAIAIAGLYLLCMTESLRLSFGDTMVIICAFCYSLHILVIDYFSPHVDGVKLSCIQFLTCGILSLIMALIFESPSISSLILAWMPILYAGALSSGVGYTLQVVAQKDTDPVIASLLMSLESAFALLAGWVILGQRLSSKELFGCLLMFAAIMLAQIPVEKWFGKDAKS